MKKRGFTLVEVLLSITIVGIVAALVFPAISKTYQRAQTYPKLQKTISMIEQANEAILKEAETKDLLLAFPYNINETMPQYAAALRKNISKSRVFHRSTANDLPWNPQIASFQGHREGQLNKDSQVLFLPTGVVIAMAHERAYTVNRFENESPTDKGDYLGKYTQLFIDLNGPTTGPNKYGRDLFFAEVYRNGSVVPTGSWTDAWLSDEDGNLSDEELLNSEYWKGTRKTNTSIGETISWNCTKAGIERGWGCAGSVIENKGVIYY